MERKENPYLLADTLECRRDNAFRFNSLGFLLWLVISMYFMGTTQALPAGIALAGSLWNLTAACLSRPLTTTQQQERERND